MLVISRKKNEKIIIGSNEDIVIEVLEIRFGKVRLAIEAPKEVPVHRQEVYKIKQAEEEQAARDQVPPEQPAE